MGGGGQDRDRAGGDQGGGGRRRGWLERVARASAAAPGSGAQGDGAAVCAVCDNGGRGASPAINLEAFRTVGNPPLRAAVGNHVRPESTDPLVGVEAVDAAGGGNAG